MENYSAPGETADSTELYANRIDTHEIARQLGLRLIHSEQRNQYLEGMVQIDQATGLLNHKTWHSLVEEFVDSNIGDFSVIFIDMTNLKSVNDSADLGHTVGDDLIVRTASILQGSLRMNRDSSTIDLVSSNTASSGNTVDAELTEGTVGRIGGDEFGILCDLADTTGMREGSPQEKLDLIINRLRRNFNTMLMSHPDADAIRRVGFDIAIGGSLWEPGKTASRLLREADMAMYADKQKYKRERQRALLTAEEMNKILAVRHILERLGIRTDFLDG